MKRSDYVAFVLVVLLAVVTLAGCTDETLETTETPTAARPTASQPPIMQPTLVSTASGQVSGTVTEVINTAGYTYVQVNTGSEKIWAAAPSFQVKVNDKVVMPPGAPMRNYHSKTLKRTFDLVYFVPSISVAGATQAGGLPSAAPPTASASGQLPSGHPPTSASSQFPSGHPKVGPSPVRPPVAAKVDFADLTKPQGGKTVAELYAEKANLSGQKISIRGKVVKFNAGIMGKNWIHLQDGTGAAGSNDLTVTTNAKAALGDTVLVRGKVVTNKDYGYGYTYSLIIEDAEVTVE